MNGWLTDAAPDSGDQSEVVVNKDHSLGSKAGFRTFLRRLLNTIFFNKNSCHNMQMSNPIEKVDEPGQTELVDVIDVFHYPC